MAFNIFNFELESTTVIISNYINAKLYQIGKFKFTVSETRPLRNSRQIFRTIISNLQYLGINQSFNSEWQLIS